MIGGMICPPAEALASTPAASAFGYPARRIVGMVSEPTAITFATADPDTVPNSAEVTTATFAGPPWPRPAITCATCTNTSPAPVAISSAPKITYTAMTLVPMSAMNPKMPLVDA